MSQDAANDNSVGHLITLSKTVPVKGSEYHKAIIESIGEAGGHKAVDHLMTLSKTVPVNGSEYHKAIVRALGRAGRIS